MRADLHTHTRFSDGTDSPSELVHAAHEAGLDTLGITDHDTTAGWAGAEQAARAVGMRLVRGMELSTQVNSRTVHVLGYLFDPDHPAMREHYRLAAEKRQMRIAQMVEKLQPVLGMSWEDFRAHYPDQDVIGRPHIADMLIARKVVATRKEAFERYLTPRCPYFVPLRAISALEAISLVNTCGGKAVLAHPWARGGRELLDVSFFRDAKEVGLFGVEVDHRDNVDRGELAGLVASFGFARFGSSDYHGLGKVNRLAEHTTSAEVVHALIEGCFLEVV